MDIESWDFEQINIHKFSQLCSLRQVDSNYLTSQFQSQFKYLINSNEESQRSKLIQSGIVSIIQEWVEQFLELIFSKLRKLKLRQSDSECIQDVNSFNVSRHLLNQPTPQAQYASIHAQQSVRMDLSNSKILVQSCNQFLHSNQGEIQIERGNHIEEPTKKICIGQSKLNQGAMITMNEVRNRILFLSPVVQDYLRI
ncbi:hypothetical protein pb186bvf_019308 [Paramecium bursaria]